MSLAAAIPSGAAELWSKVPRWFWRLGRAGQQLFIELWFRMGFRRGKLRVTDRQIAEWCGRSIRWAQKALRQLLDAIVDGVPRPLIDRYRAYGNRDEAGRIVEIIIDFKAPEPEPPAAKSPRKADPGAGQVPNVGAIPAATPEQVAAAAAQQAAATSADAAKDPESSARALDELRMALGQVKRPKAKLPRARPKIDLDAPVPPALGEKAPAGPIGDIIARLMGRTDPSGPAGQPSGP